MMDKSINGCRYWQGCKIICTFVLSIGKCMDATIIPTCPTLGAKKNTNTTARCRK